MLTERVGADFAREVFEAAGGLGWQSTALTDRDRSIAIIAAPGWPRPMIMRPGPFRTSPDRPRHSLASRQHLSGLRFVVRWSPCELQAMITETGQITGTKTETRPSSLRTDSHFLNEMSGRTSPGHVF